MLVAPGPVACGGEAEGGGDGRAGVAGAKGVAGAFVPLEESGESAMLAEGAELVGPSRQELPGVGLVADVPDNAVGFGPENGEEGKVGFEGGQMPLYRRVPKFGFKNINRIEYVGINIDVP